MSTEKRITLKIPVRSVDRLLDVEGSPIAGPRIHPDVARAIRSSASEHPRKSTFQIEVVVPAGELARQREVETAVQSHFREELAEWNDELKSIGQKGRGAFVLALVAVALIITLSEAVLLLGEHRLFTVLSESLVIIAWVSLWGPAETLLFSRFPVIRQRNLARSIVAAPVVLRAEN